jgi:putative adenylate-forming enzyme
MIRKRDILLAFFEKRWTLRLLRSRNDIEKRQKQLLHHLMGHARRSIPFYQNVPCTDFTRWPIIDKTVHMREFGNMNCHRLSRESAWELAETGLKSANSSSAFGDLTIGTSTGTSGQRGVFVVASQERALWLGSILAKCLPDFPWRKHRVAVILATGNELYETASSSGRLVFKFFDLKQGLERLAKPLVDFAPDVLIASPKTARALADISLRLQLKHLFTGGEVLDLFDSRPIEHWFGIRPRSIYQATEGFLGVACSHGHIHLNEDDMLFEEEPVAGHPNHFVPIITDLRRRAQAMIRYRLNDVLVKLDGPCLCGSPLMALQRVEGRCDDVLILKSHHGQDIQIMPDAVRSIILDAHRGLQDFRLVQSGQGLLHLTLSAETTEADAQKVKTALLSGLVKMGTVSDIKVTLSMGITYNSLQKHRRISRLPNQH